ncbi:hypothetical protein KR054_009335 [Drosophila jambulina]|nr:hypothetical protein KR054_009335 [Drosophila jambulina]
MESSIVFLLFIGILSVILVRQAHAECCTASQDVTFTMETGSCDLVGGYGGTICEVAICADGVARKGTYCGKGPCNIFGCNCDGGCLTGHWSTSFEEKNRDYGIRVLSVALNPIVL